MNQRKGLGGLHARSPPLLMKEFLRIAMLSMLVTGLCFAVLLSGLNVVWSLRSNREANQAYQKARATVRAEADTTEGICLPEVDWKTLCAQAPDVVGWIYCPDTTLDYPIVQGADNETYLKRLYTGEPNSHGSVFVDCRNASPFAEANTLVYGHNMTDGSMFHTLLNWGNEPFAQQHPALYILTPAQNYEIQVFSAYVAEPDSEAYTLAFDSGEKAQWLDRCVRHSTISAKTVLFTPDPVVTFSTCSGKAQRFVVQGMVRPL